MIWKSLILAFFFAGVIAQVEISDEQKQTYRAMLTQYCKKNGAEDKANDAAAAITSFVDCVKGLFDVSTIQKEIEEAKPHGNLDEVFKKYCAKSPELKTCLNTLTAGLTPCMDAVLREHSSDFQNATSQLLDFVCYKDGDRIALFYAEGGPECFQEKANAVRECAQKLKDTIPTVDAAKALSVTEQCAKFDELSNCVVKALEGCSTPTPGNMAESLFRYVRKSTPCEKQ